MKKIILMFVAFGIMATIELQKGRKFAKKLNNTTKILNYIFGKLQGSEKREFIKAKKADKEFAARVKKITLFCHEKNVRSITTYYRRIAGDKFQASLPRNAEEACGL